MVIMLRTEPGVGNKVQQVMDLTLPVFEIADLKDPFTKELGYRLGQYYKTRSSYDLISYIRVLVLDEQYDKAERWLQTLPDDHIFANYFRSMLAFRAGDFAKGLELYESRIPLFNYGQDKIAPRWDGKPTDKKLVIWKEGGAGDVFQYARYLLEVFSRCPNALVAVDPSLERLMSYNFPNRVITAIKLDECELQCSLCSLPYLLKDYVLNAWKYLDVPYQHLSMKVGFKGTGSGKQASNKLRSLSPEDIDFFTYGKGWISLEQKDLGTTDWFDTAKRLYQLSLIITVDTGIAHLAGALGIPVWVLLNKHHDWRWDMSWYNSARTFVCKQHSDWDEVFKQVEKELGHGQEETESQPEGAA